MVEEWKWGIPVWSHDGIICTGETYKKAVKATFAKGAALPDPAGLFNSSLDGNTRRAIDFFEGADIDEAALKALIRAAVAHNVALKAAKPAKSKNRRRGASSRLPRAARDNPRRWRRAGWWGGCGRPARAR